MIEGGASHAAIHLTSRTVASGTLTNHGTIKGGVNGLLSVSSIAGLNNSGRIEGGTGAAVNARVITALNNRGGTMTSTRSGGITARAIGTLNNSGSGEISGAEMKSGVKAGSISTLSNGANSMIKGGSAKDSENIGVSVSGMLGTLENSGTISGGYNGVEAGTITKLVNNKDGTIASGESGVEGRTIVELANKKGGTIKGDAYGVLATSRLGTLRNGAQSQAALAFSPQPRQISKNWKTAA